MTITIRNATIDDYSAIQTVAKQVHDLHIQGEPTVFQHTEDILPFHIFQSDSNKKNIYFVVAEEDEEVIGFLLCEIAYSPPVPTLQCRKCAYLLNIGVLEQNQQKGIGKKLLQSCVIWAKKQGATSLECLVWEFNKEAQIFYERVGMKTLNKNMIFNLEE